MEEIEPHMLQNKCEYCPSGIQSIKIPVEKAKKLDDSNIPPTHIEIKCPECENVFYWTQNHWDFSFSELGTLLGKPTIEVDKRKTSPGKNVYVPKEKVGVE